VITTNKTIRRLISSYRGENENAIIIDASAASAGSILERFEGATAPIVVRGYLQGTHLDGLTFDTIKARAGHMLLDPRWKPTQVYHSLDAVANEAPVSLGEYLDAAVMGQAARQDLYVRFRNLRVPLELRNALGLIRPSFLRPHEVLLPCIWMGAAGSCSNLHTDPQDNFVVCVIGHKRFWLHPPSALETIKAESVMGTAFMRSSLDPRRPDHPVSCVTVDVFAGDLLLLPLGWAHFVECVEASFTYNYWLDPRETPYFERVKKGVSR
jgi:hypothetical protein